MTAPSNQPFRGTLPPRPRRRNLPTMLPSPTDPYLPLQEAFKGRYALKCELGRGGMGIVYLAHEVALDRQVALKLLPSAIAASPAFRERFLREARTSARLSHPGILPIYTVDQVGEFVFFTMAYVDGETLADRVRSRGPLPTGEATRVLRDVAQAVAYAHAQGVIHRDLKADNILLEHGTGRALVMDFGIARVATQPEITGENEIVGTVPYMSPEQAQGFELDQRSDIYSLGVVGYFAASGRLPFVGASATEILAKHIRRPPPPLRLGGQGLDRTLARAVERCLAKRPDERFQTAGDLAAALGGALEVQGELPVPLRVFLRRVRTISQSTAGLTLVGVSALIGLIGALVRGQWGAAALAGGLMALVLAAPMAFLLPVIRRVLKAGQTHADIVQALRKDLDRQREDLAFQFGANASRAERIARRIGYAGLGLFSAGGALGVAGVLGPDLAMGTMFLGAVTTVIGGAIAAHRYQRRRDLIGERWLRFWNSRLGEWAARLAGLGLKRLPPGAASSFPRPEEALAMAAARLLEDLPEDVREALKDLPDALRRLDLQGQGLRTWIGELDSSISAERDAAAPEPVEARDMAQQRLEESLTALEAIRLFNSWVCLRARPPWRASRQSLRRCGRSATWSSSYWPGGHRLLATPDMVQPPREDAARLHLIPVTDALAAVQAHFARWPAEEDPPSPEELRELTDLTFRFVAVADALLAYVKALSGPPSRN